MKSRHIEQASHVLEAEVEPFAPAWDVRDVAAFHDICVASVWNGVRNGSIPPPYYPTPRAPRWVPHKVRAARNATEAMPRDQAETRRRARIATEAAT